MRRILLLAFALSAAAHAQVASLYVTSSNLRGSNVATGLVTTTSASTEQYTSFFTSGVGGGVTLNFLPLPVVSLGFDLRGSTRPGTVGADTAFGGLKLSVHPRVIRVKPYVEVAGGYIATRTVNVSSTTNLLGATTINGGIFTNQYAAYEVLGGVDLPILHFIDLRLIEIGGGQGYNVGGGSFNSSNASTKLSLLTINSGLVFHF